MSLHTCTCASVNQLGTGAAVCLHNTQDGHTDTCTSLSPLCETGAPKQSKHTHFKSRTNHYTSLVPYSLSDGATTQMTHSVKRRHTLSSNDSHCHTMTHTVKRRSTLSHNDTRCQMVLLPFTCHHYYHYLSFQYWTPESSDDEHAQQWLRH